MYEESPDPFCCQEIRLTDCVDDYQFQANPLCKKWIQHLASHIVRKLGTSPRIRIYAYRHGRCTLLAVDVFAAQTDIMSVCITICLTGSVIYLSALDQNQIDEDQFDIELPGITDALNLTASLHSITHEKESGHQQCLWIT